MHALSIVNCQKVEVVDLFVHYVVNQLPNMQPMLFETIELILRFRQKVIQWCVKNRKCFHSETITTSEGKTNVRSNIA